MAIASVELDSREIARPDWDTIARILERLGAEDVGDYAVLQWQESDLPYLTVGGQLNGWYVVSIEGDKETWILADPQKPSTPVAVSFPFRTNDMRPHNELFPLEIALSAVRYFYTHGRADPILPWRHHVRK